MVMLALVSITMYTSCEKNDKTEPQSWESMYHYEAICTDSVLKYCDAYIAVYAGKDSASADSVTSIYPETKLVYETKTTTTIDPETGETVTKIDTTAVYSLMYFKDVRLHTNKADSIFYRARFTPKADAAQALKAAYPETLKFIQENGVAYSSEYTGHNTEDTTEEEIETNFNDYEDDAVLEMLKDWAADAVELFSVGMK